MEKKTLLEQLLRLNTVFGPKKSTDEIQELGAIWWEMFSHIDDETFRRSVDVALKRTRFFPVPADIEAAYQEIISRPDYKAMAERTDRLIEHNETIDRVDQETMKMAANSLVEKLARKYAMKDDEQVETIVIKRRRKTPGEKREHRDRVSDQAEQITRSRGQYGD